MGNSNHQCLDQPNKGQQCQEQPSNAQQCQEQPGNGQLYQGQPNHGQSYQGQPYFGQSYQGQPYQGQPYFGQPYPGQQFGVPNVVKPNSNLVWGILTTILCCLPFGIVSIVKASKVDSLWYAGRFQDAYDASASAKNWALASAITGFVVFAIFFIIGLATS